MRLMDRIERAMAELMSEGADSWVHRQLTETAADADVVRWVSRSFQRFQDQAAQLPQCREQPDPWIASAISQDLALSVLFRLAFEAGRLDERAKAAGLNRMLDG